MLLEPSPLKMMVSKLFGEYGSAVYHTSGPTQKAMLSHHDDSQYTNLNPGIPPKPGSVQWWLRCETVRVAIVMRTVSPSDHCLNKQSYFPWEAAAQVWLPLRSWAADLTFSENLGCKSDFLLEARVRVWLPLRNWDAGLANGMQLENHIYGRQSDQGWRERRLSHKGRAAGGPRKAGFLE